MQQDTVAARAHQGLLAPAGLMAQRFAEQGDSVARPQKPANEARCGEFSIQAAHSLHHRSQASRLVHQRYTDRGYRCSSTQPIASRTEANLLTLSAISRGETLGTLGVRYDSPRGLNADGVFPAEMEALRAQGRGICEFTQLALDTDVSSRRVLAALFHTAYLHAFELRGAQLLVIEVNPRHVAYYRRMLGFKVCSEVRMNPRVQAPAVLMLLEFSHVEQQIARYGGQPALSSLTRTLYPFAFSASKEAEVLFSLRTAVATPFN
jgi:hypothetical protein